MASTIRESYTTGQDANNDAYGNIWKGQTFKSSIAHDIDQVDLYSCRVSNPGTVTVSIQAVDGSNLPDGTDLCSGTFDGNAISVTYGWNTVTFDTLANLSANTTYAIVVRALDGSVTDAFRWGSDDTSPAYSNGNFAYSNDGGSTWAANVNNDFLFKEYGYRPTSAVTPTDKTYTKIMIAVGNNEFWHDKAVPGTMAQLAASVEDLDCSIQLMVVEAFEKVFIANGTNLKIADFGNIKITTSNIGANPPDRGNILTGGSSGATIITDYITALSGACTLYGKNNSSATFSSGETVTGTDDDGNAISFVISAAEVSGPHWYNWTVYGNDSSYGAMPTYATIVTNYRGRVTLSGDKYYPHQWYMSRQSNPFDFNYAATDAQSPVSGNNSDVGEIGDVITALIPYKDDYMVAGGVSSVWIFMGDPMEGGALKEFDLTTGIYGPMAWCFDNEGNIFFWGANGLYASPVPGIPKCISEVRLPDLVNDEAVDPATYRITLQYDRRRSGVLIFITKLSDGSNSNYWYDLRTSGFFPEVYPDECGVFSAHFYEATDPAYRKLIVGCYDGYLRFYDETQKDDDIGDTDQAINAYVTFGPFPLGDGQYRKGKFVAPNLITAGGASGGGQSDSNDVGFKIFVSDDAEKIIEDIVANTGAKIGGTFKSPGRQPGNRCQQKVKGAYAGVRLVNNTAAETWAFEKFIAKIVPSGRIR